MATKRRTKKPMPHSHISPGLKSGSRKKRLFKTSGANIAAAVSMPEPLYKKALTAAEEAAEGNFSRYVRSLIHRDLKAS